MVCAYAKIKKTTPHPDSFYVIKLIDVAVLSVHSAFLFRLMPSFNHIEEFD